ncbi:ABC transporter ATP-binding protein [Falsirhodobacter sp. 20TX0035]|uniref:ABC transporter ATP-binding protein n=1 Tax=Falsirhodobacter sp. 20TX0035 TaxID=3022019 RepID=UPI002330C6EC|nr:ABC transporter ATP-binding protein [Falsirhodobacter sp. 20TX0035]MDB6454129.1 ABC transporter ATP-binding protein [Falsirhodobacter sp. 20TX0035]
MISLTKLTKTFNGPPAVDDVTLSVPEGGFLVLLGPSGCGKSTMLRMLAGLETPTSGTIRFGDTVVADGARITPPDKRDAGLVFQSYALWPHMTVAGNVDWPLKVAGTPNRAGRVAEALKMMGIADLAHRYPGEISGGQQQRVALARMIAPRPKFLLFDEPLSNLDATLRVEMRHELSRLHKTTGATAVYVTHDQIEAMTLATHVAVMNRGRVEQFASPLDLLAKPATAFVARFVGTPPANLIPIRDGAWLARLPDAALRGATGHAMVRAEDLTLATGPRSLSAELMEAIPMAGQLLVTGAVGGHRITCVAPAGTPLTRDLHFALPDAPGAIFDIEGNPIR